MLRILFTSFLLSFASCAHAQPLQWSAYSDAAENNPTNATSLGSASNSPHYSLLRKNSHYAARPSFGADVAWDNFYHGGESIWMCREVKTGIFLPPRFCTGKERVDTQWPGTLVPTMFNGQLGD